jgi:hypothetical protein
MPQKLVTPITGHPDRVTRDWQTAAYERALAANPMRARHLARVQGGYEAMRYLRYDAPPEVDAARAVTLWKEAAHAT